MATPPPPKNPWTAADDTKLLELHGQGLTLTAIAKAMGRGKQTISQYASRTDPPLSFDRGPTATATAAKVVDAKARNVIALEREQDILDFEQTLIRDVQLRKSTWRTTLRGAGGAEIERDLTYIPPQDAERAHRGRSAMVGTIAKLTDLTADHGADTAKSILGTLAASLGLKDGSAS